MTALHSTMRLKNKSALLNRIWKHRAVYLVMLPGLLCLLTFNYLPIAGLTMAFTDFKPTGRISALFTGEWVGLEHFRRLFATPYFWTVIKNTLIINAYRLVFVFPAPIIFALLLDEIRSARLRNSIQIVSYLPAFLSVVVIYGLATALLSPAGGLINSLAEKVGLPTAHYLADKRFFRGILVGLDVWRYTGLDALIYLGSLACIDKSLYEAAQLDGASRWKRIVHIKLPHLSGICLILLLFRIGNILNGDFDTVFMFYSEPVYCVGDIIDTYAYRQGIINFDYSYAAAVGAFKSVVGFGLVLLFWAFFKSKILHHDNGGGNCG